MIAATRKLAVAMSKFKFPRNPGVGREDPFEDERGKNPFGDDAKADPRTDDVGGPSDGNPYAAQEQATTQPYEPADYETFLPHRGSLVFWFGVVGAGLQIVAIGMVVIAVWWTEEFLNGVVFGLPGQLLGLAVSVPAWVIGHSDFRAIEAGAMDSEGRRATRAGLRLGIAGSVSGVTQLLLYLGLLIYNAVYA
jgi:hypothetical protein